MGETLNSKAKKFIKNFSYTIISNIISLIVSSLVVLIIPKIIGVNDYGFWQLYLFYSSYVGFLHFGWNDGIYLRYGGKKYEELNKRLFHSQFIMLLVLQVVIAALVFIISIIFIVDLNRGFIFRTLAVNMILVNSRYLYLYILQATNRIKNYAQITILDRLIYISLVIFMLLLGTKRFELLIIADLIGKICSLMYAMSCCREIAFNSIISFETNLKEMIANISIGIKLMFANIASMLLIGVVRFGIERTWNVATFGKVSLTLSISKLIMIFINAVGLIMYPLLRRSDYKKLTNIYGVMRNVLMAVTLGVLVFQYPLKILLNYWLPDYEDGLKYMVLIFPMFLYEGKMSLLINTYFKTLRKEKIMLRINLLALLVSIILTVINTVLLKNLNMTVLSIVIILAFRSISSELILSKLISIKVTKDIIYEQILVIIFILSAWATNSISSVIIYSISYFIYIFIKRKDIKLTVDEIKEMLLTKTY